MNEIASTNQDAISKGSRCQRCGHRHLRVVYTRRGQDEKIVRRRACRRCGERMTTWEEPVRT